MIIKVSKVFAKFINETANARGFSAFAEVVEIPESKYNFFVGYGCASWDDFNYKTGCYKALRVSYPGDYYASPVYFTTQQLNREFNARAVCTVDDLRDMLQDLIEI